MTLKKRYDLTTALIEANPQMEDFLTSTIRKVSLDMAEQVENARTEKLIERLKDYGIEATKDELLELARSQRIVLFRPWPTHSPQLAYWVLDYDPEKEEKDQKVLVVENEEVNIEMKDGKYTITRG